MDTHPSDWRKAPVQTRVLAVLALIALIAGAALLAGGAGRNPAATSEIEVSQSGEKGEPAAAQVDTSAQSPEPPARGQQRHYVSVALLSFGMLLLLVVVAMEVARQRSEGWSWSRGRFLGPLAITPLPLNPSTVWISVDSSAQRRLKLGQVLGAIVLAAYVFGNYLIVRNVDLTKPWARIILTLAAILTALVAIGGLFGLRAMRRSASSRIGITSNAALVDPGTGNIERSPLDEVRVGATNLLIGRRIVPVIDQWQRPFFPRDQVEGYLLSRLPPSAFLKNSRFYLEAFRRGNVHLRAVTIAALLCMALSLLAKPLASYLSSII